MVSSDVADETLRAFDSLRTAFAVFDPDDCLIYHNEQFKFVYQSFQEVDSLIGMRFEEILRLKVDMGEIAGTLAIEDPEAWIAWRLELHRQERHRLVQRLTDGRWMEIKERRTPSGGVISQWHDVTDAQRAELRLEDAIECTADGFAIWDQRGRLSMFNHRFADRFGVDGHVIKKGRIVADVLRRLGTSGAVVLDQPVDKWVAGCLERRQQPETQQVLEFEDGEFYLVRERRTRDGGVTMVLTDITELKEKERELIFRGQSLQAALSEIDMAKQVLEDQANNLAQMAEDTEAARETAEQERRRAEVLRIEAKAREAHIEAILSTMGDGLVVANARGEVEEINPAAQDMFGWSADDLIGESINRLMPDDVANKHDDYVRAYNDSREPRILGKTREVQGRRKGGSLFPLELVVTAVETPYAPYFIASARDITERKQAEQALKDNEQRFRDLAANVPGVIYQWVEYADGDRGYTYVSPRSQEVLGIAPGDLAAEPRRLSSHAEDAAQFKESFHDAVGQGADWIYEGRFQLPSGTVRWLRGLAKPIRTPEGDLLYNGVFLDITHQKEMEDQLRRLATTDPLTEVLNRRAFLQAMEAELERVRRYDRTASLLACDLDHFKRINDTFGHQVGDEALRIFAFTARDQLREADTLGRLGGEEFAILLPETDSAAAAVLAERLRVAVREAEVPAESASARMTVSIGISAVQAGDDSLNDILKRADDALYEAKDGGRDQVVLASCAQKNSAN